METSKEVVASVYNMSLDSITMALALTVALAWVAVVKRVINTYVSVGGDGLMYYIIFALVVTAIFVLVTMFMRKVLKASIITPTIVPTIAGVVN